MNKKIIDVRCIKSYGKLYNWDLTMGKIYKDALVIWTDDVEEDGMVKVINDRGIEEEFAINPYFEIVE